MVGFPDESQMERSQDGSEPIRGGSIGFNRILGMFVDAANQDQKPRFNALVVSAFTIVRNVLGSTKETMKLGELETGFVKDVNLLLEYFNQYLLEVWSRLSGDKFCPVIIYFPDYRHVSKEIERERTEKQDIPFKMYQTLLAQQGNDDGEVRKLDRVRCFWVRSGHATYPHKEVVRKFREITDHPQCLYTTGDPVGLISHIPLDWYMASRLRGVQLIESHTARIRKPDEFRLKLDKDGRVPFQPAVHVSLGDGVQIKQLASHKARKEILEAADKERWLTRGGEDIRNRISQISGIAVSTLKKYDFV